jgi:hypothetical protein
LSGAKVMTMTQKLKRAFVIGSLGAASFLTLIALITEHGDPARANEALTVQIERVPSAHIPAYTDALPPHMPTQSASR